MTCFFIVCIVLYLQLHLKINPQINLHHHTMKKYSYSDNNSYKRCQKCLTGGTLIARGIWGTGAWGKVVRTHLSTLQQPGCTQAQCVDVSMMSISSCKFSHDANNVWFILSAEQVNCLSLDLSQTVGDYFWIQSRWNAVFFATLWLFLRLVDLTSNWHINTIWEPVQHPLLDNISALRSTEAMMRIRFWGGELTALHLKHFDCSKHRFNTTWKKNTRYFQGDIIRPCLWQQTWEFK